MAVTSYGVNDALAMKAWSRKLAQGKRARRPHCPLFGVAELRIQMKEEAEQGQGDKVTFGLRMQLSGAGVTENETLEGSEESLTTYSDSIFINELAHAVRVKNEGTIDAARSVLSPTGGQRRTEGLVCRPHVAVLLRPRLRLHRAHPRLRGFDDLAELVEVVRFQHGPRPDVHAHHPRWRAGERQLAHVG